MAETETVPVPTAAPPALRIMAVLIPSCTDPFLERLLTSMEKLEPGSAAFCVIGDNGLSPSFHERWDGQGERPGPVFVQIAKPFIFAKAINRLAEEASKRWPGCDLLVLNDDTEMVNDGWLSVARRATDPLRTQWGMLSFEIDGGVGNREQAFSPGRGNTLIEAKHTICFVACIVTRECWDRIGALDERFSGYGFDDDDYCRRVKKEQLRTGIIGGLVVKHGAGGFPHSSSYARLLGQEEWNRQYKLNARIFAAKWGDASVANKVCLNIGCGDKPRPSEGLEKWVNLDHQAGPGVDVVRDLRRGIPFNDETFDYLVADNVLEHFANEDLIFLINEIDRVLKVGGLAEIIVPHFQSHGAVQDPTHKTFFSPRSAIYWNQVMSTRGGKFVGITANLLPAERSHIHLFAYEGGREVEANAEKHPEFFIRFLLTKMPLNAMPKEG